MNLPPCPESRVTSSDLFGVSCPAMESGKGKAFSHDRSEDVNHKYEWLTPPEIIKALGPFDLDPCSPVPDRRPWPTARNHYDITDNGLRKEWKGRVWCNPPYENSLAGSFLSKCADHGNAIVLIFARVETGNWFDYIWGRAHAVLFIKGRLCFYHSSGKPAEASAGAPSALIAYGAENAAALKFSGIEGYFIELQPNAEVSHAADE